MLPDPTESVSIQGSMNGMVKVRAGVQETLVCLVSGARPKPKITWAINGDRSNLTNHVSPILQMFSVSSCRITYSVIFIIIHLSDVSFKSVLALRLGKLRPNTC